MRSAVRRVWPARLVAMPHSGYFAAVDARLSAWARTDATVRAATLLSGTDEPEPFVMLTLPRLPFNRMWPIVREIAVVMCLALALVLIAPPAFETLPVFHVDPRTSAWQQARAALLGAFILTALVVCDFALYAVLYVYRWRRGVHAFASIWLSATLGVPSALLLLRCCEAAGSPLDALSFAFAVWNFVVPGCVLIQWHATSERFQSPGRRVYAATLAILGSWMLACVPYPTLIALLGMLTLVDGMITGADRSPVQRLDVVVTRRRLAGEAEMPGLTFFPAKTDGLFLGIGDFVVFSVFATHAARGGAAPLAAVAVALLTALSQVMLHVTLQWPQRALAPILPTSVTIAAALLAGERFAVRPMAEALAAAAAWL